MSRKGGTIELKSGSFSEHHRYVTCKLRNYSKSSGGILQCHIRMALTNWRVLMGNTSMSNTNYELILKI